MPGCRRVGVANALAHRFDVIEGSAAFGRALKHLVFLELRAYLDYGGIDRPLTYWRSRSRLEVDFMIGDEAAIEVKSTGRVDRRHYKGLLALAEEVPLARKLVVCTEARRRTTDDGVDVVPVEDFLHELWEREIV